ncbi:hypothetical protein GXP71_10205 [Cellulomonas sp. H30R-01]|uniref:DUF6529 family protein n=1 Tax=Cellulomonas sp. H30R-01 TaxID=2704467 RepID=UPI00138CB18B|nr:DUF6529 family protein [Cellulomonas sp. H30R-01]QHT56410.1 hypothetical protein GXP71_10205 [Cellulomonas sp. H30R-01]
MGVTQAPPSPPTATAPWRWSLAGVTALGLGVAAALAAYADAHPGDGATLLTLWFSGMLQLKAWFTTAALVLVLVQVLSALAMWGRLPGVRGGAPAGVALLHRWSGVVAFLLTLPVAFQCVWSLGFEDEPARVLVHSVAGCLFYGAFAAKMLALRLPRLPSVVVPLLGATVATLLVVVWFSSALWFFTQPGLPRV